MFSGLLTKDRRKIAGVPLQSIEISGEVTGLFGEFRLTQKYRNNTSRNLEVVYTFPLPDRAAVTGFAARTGSLQARGEVKSKEEAFALYDDSLLKGDSAFIIEQYRPNVFQVSLGQLGPEEEAEVEISYLQEFRRCESELRITIPTVVAPRYIPGQGQGKKHGTGTRPPTDRVPDADFITPPVGDAGYAISMELLIRPFAETTEIVSPSHAIRAELLADGRYRVCLAAGETAADRDIVIICRHSYEAGAYGVIAGREGKGYLYLEFIPELPPVQADGGREYIFLLDISGSMDGEKLEQAKTALKLCLRNLTGKDTFNIVAFESNCHFFSPASLPFDQAGLEAAEAWIDRLQSQGGTEILEPVAFALCLPAGRQRVTLLFTDGQVGNEAEITALVRDCIGDGRLFPFGIDTTVNEHFINSLAEAGNGSGEFVYPGERLEDKVLRQFARIISPAVTGAEVNWGTLQVGEVYPAAVGPVFDLEPVSFIASFSGVPSGNAFLNCNRQQLALSPDLASLVCDERYSFLEKLFAKRKMEALKNTLYRVNPRREKAVRAEIIELCKAFSLTSDYTSFVAVLERQDKAGGLPETVVVPIAPPAGWGMNYNSLTLSLGEDISRKTDNYLPIVCESQLVPSKHLQGGPIGRRASSTGSNLRQLAQKQLADGSFGKKDDPLRQKILATGMAVLAFTLDSGHLAPYSGQLRKAALYLLEYAQSKADTKDLPPLLVAVLAIQTVLDRGLLRGEMRRETGLALAELKQQVLAACSGGGPAADYLAGRLSLDDIAAVIADRDGLTEAALAKIMPPGAEIRHQGIKAGRLF